MGPGVSGKGAGSPNVRWGPWFVTAQPDLALSPLQFAWVRSATVLVPAEQGQDGQGNGQEGQYNFDRRRAPNPPVERAGYKIR